MSADMGELAKFLKNVFPVFFWVLCYLHLQRKVFLFMN